MLSGRTQFEGPTDKTLHGTHVMHEYKFWSIKISSILSDHNQIMILYVTANKPISEIHTTFTHKSTEFHEF